MQDYVRRLVVRIGDKDRPLSRNRHFHTFATRLGRKAVKLSRQLRSLARSLVDQTAHGGSLRLERLGDGQTGLRLCLHLERLKAKRTVYLSPAEWELLLREPGVPDALKQLGVDPVDTVDPVAGR